MTSERVELPQPTTTDTGHTLTKAGLSGIPVLGGPAAELFNLLIVPPLTKRRDAWLRSLADGLTSLEERVEGFSIEKLSHNEEFVTMVMEASNIAIRNHAKEKVDALRNAVLNAAIDPPEEAFQSVVLRFIEAATPWHFRVLAFYQTPEAHIGKTGLELSTGDYLREYVSRVFPELEHSAAFRLQIERDLLHYGLIYPEGEWYSKRTTDTGDKVLAKISAPV